MPIRRRRLLAVEIVEREPRPVRRVRRGEGRVVGQPLGRPSRDTHPEEPTLTGLQRAEGDASPVRGDRVVGLEDVPRDEAGGRALEIRAADLVAGAGPRHEVDVSRRRDDRPDRGFVPRGQGSALRRVGARDPEAEPPSLDRRVDDPPVGGEGEPVHAVDLRARDLARPPPAVARREPDAPEGVLGHGEEGSAVRGRTDDAVLEEVVRDGARNAPRQGHEPDLLLLLPLAARDGEERVALGAATRPAPRSAIPPRRGSRPVRSPRRRRRSSRPSPPSRPRAARPRRRSAGRPATSRGRSRRSARTPPADAMAARTRASEPSAFAIMRALCSGVGWRVLTQAMRLPSREKAGAQSIPVTSRRAAPPSVEIE